MLNAILTSDVPREENAGLYALLLDPKGRIQTDLRVLKGGDGLLVVTEPEGAEAARQILGRYAPFSRVELKHLPDWSVLGLYGPRAAERLGYPDLAEHETRPVEMDSLLVVGVAAPVGGYDLIGPSGMLRAIRERLVDEDVILASPDEYETARVEAGVPRFGRELTPANFPGESSVLGRAVDFKKGCYPGQETVARMHYRGSPNKVLYRFELEDAPDEPAEPGDEILPNDRKWLGPVGTVDVASYVTSVSPLAVGGRRFALGYLPRKLDPEAPMRVEDAAILASRPA
jgi:aminomethyltransferase